MREVFFNGPEGRLEGKYQEGSSPESPLALVLHPNSLEGGSMNNKVTYAMFQTFVHMGFSVLRFNFRGVGRSQGVFDGGAGELGDAAAALDWMQTLNRDAKNFWIAGYSFGAWIGMQLLMRRPEINGFISVAPPANTKDFSFLAPCPSSGLIVSGALDEQVTEASVCALADKLAGQRNTFIGYKSLPHADHSFDNNLSELSRAVRDYVNELTLRRQKKAAKLRANKKRAKEAAENHG